LLGFFWWAWAARATGSARQSDCRFVATGKWHSQRPATARRRRRGGGGAYHHSPPIATADLQRSLSPVTSTGSPDPSFSLHALSRNCIACSWIAFLKSHQSLHVMEFSAEKWQDNELSFHRIQQSFRIEVVRSFTNPTPFSNLPPNL